MKLIKNYPFKSANTSGEIQESNWLVLEQIRFILRKNLPPTAGRNDAGDV